MESYKEGYAQGLHDGVEMLRGMADRAKKLGHPEVADILAKLAGSMNDITPSMVEMKSETEEKNITWQ